MALFSFVNGAMTRPGISSKPVLLRRRQVPLTLTRAYYGLAWVYHTCPDSHTIYTLSSPGHDIARKTRIAKLRCSIYQY